MRRTLTDRVIRALKPAADNKPYDVMHTGLPPFGVRVMPSRNDQTPVKTFILVARYAGPRSNPTRRSLDRYGEVTLDRAIEKARRWLDLIARNVNPADEERRAAEEAARRRAGSVRHIVEDYIEQETGKQRRGANVARELKRVVLPIWGPREAASITRGDVQRLIEAIRDRGAARALAAHGIELQRGHDKPAPTYARNLLSHLRTLFSFALEADCYGLHASPCDHLRAERILGPRPQRSRSLTPDELAAFWRATGRMPYPTGPALRLLLLTGLRLNEVFRAERSEFDLRNRLWTIRKAG
jgi:integrase